MMENVVQQEESPFVDRMERKTTTNDSDDDQTVPTIASDDSGDGAESSKKRKKRRGNTSTSSPERPPPSDQPHLLRVVDFQSAHTAFAPPGFSHFHTLPPSTATKEGGGVSLPLRLRLPFLRVDSQHVGNGHNGGENL